MTTRKKLRKPQRIVRSDEYKKDAVKLADTVGATEAAKQLGVHTTQIYNWRTKLRVKESRTEAETRLMDENARLTRKLAEKKQENDFLKNLPPDAIRFCRKRNSRCCTLILHPEAEAAGFLVA